jgi:hypothetical protein
MPREASLGRTILPSKVPFLLCLDAHDPRTRPQVIILNRLNSSVEERICIGGSRSSHSTSRRQRLK